MKLQHFLAHLGLLCGITTSCQASRAFPIPSENYATQLFKTLNPKLQWDPTNFLVDYSGRYSTCNHVGQRGRVAVKRLTDEGESVGGLVDYAKGKLMTATSVNKYIVRAISTWTNDATFSDQIKVAQYFGCSVRPGCAGNIVISCLFSPSLDGQLPNESQSLPKALAFTKQQYDLTEIITGNNWDRSHYLEDLSGYETDCAMVEQKEWSFAHAHKRAKKRHMEIEGVYGVQENEGSTEAAMVKILEGWKRHYDQNTKLGCSIIPHCKVPGNSKMYIVISCLFGGRYL